MCMPEVACRIEVEEMPDTEAVHVWCGWGSCESLYSILQWVDSRLHVQRSPLSCPIAIHRTHLKVVVGCWLEIFEKKRVVADSGIGLTIEVNLIVVSILHRLPLWRNAIRLNVSLEEFRSRQSTLLAQGFVRLVQTCETLHAKRYSLLCDVAGSQTNDDLGIFSYQ